MFQSSPAPRRGRYPPTSPPPSPPTNVSILARAEARALLYSGGTTRATVDVSILARAEARALRSLFVQKLVPAFVSILARAEARALPTAADIDASQPVVSILARAEARALRRSMPGGRWGRRSFNPRPRRGAGATGYDQTVQLYTHVSILARAEARALHQRSAPDATLPMFQSSPAPRRGRYPRAAPKKTAALTVSILARAEARALP